MKKHRGLASRPGRVAPKSDTGNTKKESAFEDSRRLIIFVLRMYKQQPRSKGRKSLPCCKENAQEKRSHVSWESANPRFLVN